MHDDEAHDNGEHDSSHEGDDAAGDHVDHGDEPEGFGEYEVTIDLDSPHILSRYVMPGLLTTSLVLTTIIILCQDRPTKGDKEGLEA